MTSPVSSVHKPQNSSNDQSTPPPVPEPQRNDKKPTVLESHGYNLGKTIGNGSYAIVKVAYSNRHESDVAIKIVSKFSAPSDYIKKFLPREIEVVKGLRHPNLIRFLQAIETTHRVYIIMEYAEKGSLLDVIRRDHYIDEPRARRWFQQLVDVVEYCHERGIVHRDIKCENLLMDSGYNMKLSDFGFAKGHTKSKYNQMPLSETFCGSYAYASPEILRGIPYQPQNSDIWSMGVVLFAMVFGRLPFDDSNYKELLKQVSAKVVFPKDPKVSPGVKSLIHKILAPLKSRIRINGIKNDSWFTESSGVGTSKDNTSEEDSDRRLSIPSSQIADPKLITKEQLKNESKPRDRTRRSTTEESPIDVKNLTLDVDK